MLTPFYLIRIYPGTTQQLESCIELKLVFGLVELKK